MKYEGGTLPISQGKTKATIAGDRLVFSRGRERVAIPLENITAISCTTEMRRRFGAPVLGVIPWLHLDTEETHYVGLTWTGKSRNGQPVGRIEAVLKLSGGEYGDFLGTLEQLTGKKAVNSKSVPSVVRYGL
jgi:hypothetical protein